MAYPDIGQIFLHPVEKRIALFDNVDGELFHRYALANIQKVKEYLPFSADEENKLWCHEFIRYFCSSKIEKIYAKNE